MVAFSDTSRLTLPVAPVGTGAAALCAMLAGLAVPTWRIESLAVRSGLPALFAAAGPPLGWTARSALALASGIAVAAVAWVVLRLWVGGRRVPLLVRKMRTGPNVRRADAHPDAPPRPPILAARDLGPAMEEAADKERPLPADLATPLVGYAAGARALPPPRPAPLGPGERIETFALLHDVPPEHAHSIESLLARLERGAQARGLARGLG